VNSKKAAWNALAKVFSDDFNLKINDLLLHLLYHATRKPRARLFMLMHVCARASSKQRASLTSAPIVASDLFSIPLSYISKVARKSGRAAPAGDHHGGPRGATPSSQPGSPGGGAAPTFCPAAAQMTATKRISDVLFPRGFEVVSPRRSLQSTRVPSSFIRRSIYPRRKKFLPPSKGGVSTRSTGSEPRISRAILPPPSPRSRGAAARPENEINTDRRSNALLICQFAVF
jgi:hypothetical protein